jgi:YVTN family beta-propeller protein
MAAVIATIPVGNFPDVVAVSPNGARAYVVNSFGGTLSVINTATNTVTATIPVSNNPRAVALSPDGTRAYVTNSASNDFVAVIDTATNTTITTIPVGGIPNGVAVSPGRRPCLRRQRQ